MDAATLKGLGEPFPAEDIEWRAGATNKDKTKALALAYITSRAVMNRLDETIGAENWQDEYSPGPDGGVLCGLSIRVNNEWITKWDGAENTAFEGVKGGLSDALKRAGVKWGIGRYLYKLDGVWVKCEQRGNTTVLSETPKLPSWALPPEDTDEDWTAEEMDSVVEGEYTEAPKEESKGRVIKKGTANIARQFVDSSIAENVPNAAAILNRIPQSIKTDSDKLKWGKLYRGFRDQDNGVDDAVELANKGMGV